MGRKKKFIDKKTAATFHIVQRRQDGNYDGVTVTGSKYMLQPARYDTRLPADFPLDLLQVPAHAVAARQAANERDDHQDDSEGDDEYDYEQHFRTIGEAGPDTASAIFIANPSAPKLEILQKVVEADNKEDDTADRLFAEAIKPEKTGLLKISKDLAKALDGEEGFEELNDDFVLMAVREQKFDLPLEQEEEEYEGDLFGEEEGDEGEEEAEEEEEGKKEKVSARNQLLADQLDELELEDEDDEGDEGEEEGDEEEEEEVGGRPKRLLDAQFDSLLAQYDDEEDIGELDPDNPELQGGVENLAEFEQEITEFAQRQEKDYGGEQAAVLTEEEKKQVIEKLQLTEEEETIAATHANIDAMFKVTEKENWDCESIVSTYSNTENHPVMIKRPSKAKTIKLSGKTGIPIGYFPTREKPQPETVPEGKEEEEEEEEEEGEGDEGAGANLGEKRNKQETKEEKQARKKEVKAARREARGRKKDLKLQYSAELNRQLQFDHHQKLHNPPVTKMK